MRLSQWLRHWQNRVFEFSLSACKFCGGSSQEIECTENGLRLWTAVVHCGGCEATMMPFYAKSSKEDAMRAAIERWNRVPKLKTSGAESVVTALSAGQIVKAISRDN